MMPGMTHHPPPAPPSPGGPPPWQPGPAKPVPAKAGIRSRWWFIPAIALVTLLVGIGIGSSGGSTSAKVKPGATITATATATATLQVTTTPTKVIATRTVQVRVTYTPPPVNEFSDGTYRVGPDIPPGVYKTPGGSQCYYAILNSLDTNDIASNNNFTGPTVVQLRAGKAFEASGGCDWSRVG